VGFAAYWWRLVILVAGATRLRRSRAWAASAYAITVGRSQVLPGVIPVALEEEPRQKVTTSAALT